MVNEQELEHFVFLLISYSLLTQALLKYRMLHACYPGSREQGLKTVVFSSVAAVQSCFCFIIVAAAIVLGIGALFLLFVLLYSQRVASQ